MSAVTEFASAVKPDRDDPLLAALRAIVGDAYAVPDAEAPDALVDHRRRYVGRARAVVYPGSTAEVAAVVQLLAEEAIPIVPQGGHTSLVGGATPDGSGRAVVLSLKRLDRVREIDLDNDTITVEAGLILRKVQDAARQSRRLFPLSLGSEDSCTIGGNLGANAGGVQVLRYGNTRDLTLGLEVVTPSGEIWNGLRGLRKDNSGYDLRDLYIGSEGTLGIITAATLKLYPLPVAQRTAFIKLDSSESVLVLLNQARAGFGASLTAFEAISGAAYALVNDQMPEEHLPFAAEAQSDRWYVLLEISDNESDDRARERLEQVVGDAIEDGVAIDAVVAESVAQSQALWRLRQYSVAQAQARDGGVVPHDISLPISAIPVFLWRNAAALQSHCPGVRVFAHGHFGDGNLHYHIGRPRGEQEGYLALHEDRIRSVVHDDVALLGGSIAAEHGVGRSKRDELLRHKSGVEIRLMQAIKQALDPDGIMNPGKLLPR
jgi:FAD/FMN-containing dehydrogenase